MEVESSFRSLLLLRFNLFVRWMPFPRPICRGGLGFGSIISHFIHVVIAVAWWLVLLSTVLCLLPGIALRGTDIRLTMDLVLLSTSMHCHDWTLCDQTG